MRELSEVYPGEAALNFEIIRNYEVLISAGGNVCPPELVFIDNHYIVRDGNHRVCAWIESFKLNNKINPIKFVFSQALEPTEIAKKQLVAFAKYHGPGIDGFLKIKKVPDAEYFEEHGRMQLEILGTFDCGVGT